MYLSCISLVNLVLFNVLIRGMCGRANVVRTPEEIQQLVGARRVLGPVRQAPRQPRAPNANATAPRAGGRRQKRPRPAVCVAGASLVISTAAASKPASSFLSGQASAANVIGVTNNGDIDHHDNYAHENMQGDGAASAFAFSFDGSSAASSEALGSKSHDSHTDSVQHTARPEVSISTRRVNVGPTQLVPVLYCTPTNASADVDTRDSASCASGSRAETVCGENELSMRMMQWGLITGYPPQSWQGPLSAHRQHNVRTDNRAVMTTIMNKKSSRSVFGPPQIVQNNTVNNSTMSLSHSQPFPRLGRCAIIVDGFYEWPDAEAPLYNQHHNSTAIDNNTPTTTSSTTSATSVSTTSASSVQTAVTAAPRPMMPFAKGSEPYLVQMASKYLPDPLDPALFVPEDGDSVTNSQNSQDTIGDQRNKLTTAFIAATAAHTVANSQSDRESSQRNGTQLLGGD